MSPTASKAVRRVGLGALVGLCAGVLVCVADALGMFARAEFRAWDVWAKMFADPARASKEIVVLLITQDSLDYAKEKLGAGWPWRRDFYEQIIRCMEAHQARAVVFDVGFFDEHEGDVGQAEEDKLDPLLVEATRSVGKVYHAISFLPEAKQQALRPSQHQALLATRSLSVTGQGLDLPAYAGVDLPIRTLVSDAAGVGAVNAIQDQDGVTRRANLLFEHRGKTFPSLAMATALGVSDAAQIAFDGKQLLFDDHRVGVNRRGEMLLCWRGPSGTFQTHPFHHVLTSWINESQGKATEIDLAQFRDRIVLIGSNVAGLHDLKTTPTQHIFPGVEVQATAIDNLLAGDALGWPKRRHTIALALGFGILCGICTIGFYTASVSVPLALLCLLGAVVISARSYSAAGQCVALAAPCATIVLTFSAAAWVNFATEGRRRRLIRKMFSTYVPPSVVSQMEDNQNMFRLGGERRELTVLFSDIRGFTTLAEGLDAEQLTTLLNEYLTVMTDIVFEEGGTLDKYVGDMIVAIYGAPMPMEDHAHRACRTALRMSERLTVLCRQWEAEGRPTFDIGIGVNSGLITVGNMGSRRRFDYTVIGDAVNLGSRLEGLNKEYGTRILIGEETQRRLGDRLVCRDIDWVAVKGKAEPVRIYELCGSEAASETAKVHELFAAGIELYRERDWRGAAACLCQALEIDASDGPSRTFLERLEELQKSPPGDDWQPITRMDHK